MTLYLKNRKKRAFDMKHYSENKGQKNSCRPMPSHWYVVRVGQL